MQNFLILGFYLLLIPFPSVGCLRSDITTPENSPGSPNGTEIQVSYLFSLLSPLIESPHCPATACQELSPPPSGTDQFPAYSPQGTLQPPHITGRQVTPSLWNSPEPCTLPNWSSLVALTGLDAKGQPTVPGGTSCEFLNQDRESSRLSLICRRTGRENVIPNT